MYRYISGFIVLIALLSGGIYWLSSHQAANGIRSSIAVAEAMGNTDTTGYDRAIEPIEFRFPRDHGPHPGFKTEWWYFTGNLTAESGERFGYQFTLFRSALSPQATARNSTWAANQLYMGHFAVSDIDNEKFYFFERFSRGDEQLAGARTHPFRVWLEDWYCATASEDSLGNMPAFEIRAGQDDVLLELTMESEKPLVLQGDQGLSQKGPGSGNASYYYSLTRLKAVGTVQIAGKTYEISGNSWMDREWSTSALGEDQIGWDWFSLQFSDGQELMYYQLRNKDGSSDKFSKGILVDKSGKGKVFYRDEIELLVNDYWESPLGGRYPSDWTLNVPAENLSITVTPFLKNQELDVAVRYWEGAVAINGERNGKPFDGRGYVELTGYADQ